MSKEYFLLLSVWLLVALLAITKIITSSLISTDGIDLSQLQTQDSAVKKQNILLKEQVAKGSAFTTISQEASKEGFVIDNDVLFLSHY